ncbi:MAG: hypothetical protein A3H44_08105 [Gammaproteobacteria bacterium RIFCSPLOWO2_02_FULL_57_10]|nr:MAG: hypothetical protein A3H44_08105 [Gammaproteobacteria bacterium RIFCSPLOWO2_02_FULL_57_10]
MLFDPLLLIIYVAVSAIVGFLGRNRSVGFAGIFTFSLIVSPVIVALVLLVTAPVTSSKST